MLIIALRDKESFGVRSCAAKALGQIKDTRAVDALIEALGDREDYVKGAVAWALGEIGDPRAVEPLMERFGYMREMRESCAEALGKIGDPRAIEALVLCPGIKAVQDALLKFGSAAVQPLIAKTADLDWAWGAVEALVRMLETIPDGVRTEDLRAIVSLNNVSNKAWAMPTGCSIPEAAYVSGTEPVDCSRLKQLARQELVRREHEIPATVSTPKPTTILVKCECGAQMEVDAQYAGRSGKCRVCGRTVIVPTL
jgi:hypothetical protein